MSESTESVEPEPTLDQIEQEGAALREKLVTETEAANAGFDTPPKPEAQPAAEAQPEPEKQPGQTGKPRNERGQFVKQEQAQAEAQPQVEAQPDQPAKPESSYAKAKKDAERKDRSWRKLEEDKAEFQRQRAEYERQQQAFAQQVQQQQAQAQQRQQQQDTRFSPEEFERAAEWYDTEAEKAIQNGDLEKYQEFRKNAGLTRKAAKETAQRQQQAQQQQAEAQFRSEYEASYARAVEKNPDLASPETEIGKRMLATLQEAPILQMIPNGFEMAYELIQLQDKAKGHDDAVARAEKAEAEVARLTKLMQPGAGAPAAPSTSDAGENGSLADQERMWRNRVNAGQPIIR